MVDELLQRYDASVFSTGERRVRLRLAGLGSDVDVELDADGARAVAPGDGRPDALITGDADTWAAIGGGHVAPLEAFQSGRLLVRHDLHLGVGFLAATSGAAAGLRFAEVETSIGPISTMAAGDGDPVVFLHGLGATKASFLPTVAGLAATHRAIALDLPGFGDSVKPLNGAYDPPFFADAVVALLDALELERADVVGNSMGGRAAIELALRHPDRVRRIVGLAPSLAWLRSRPFAPLLRLVSPQLGALHPAPRVVVEAIVARTVDGADQWTAAGVDEFLRSFLTPNGRVAFYAAARNIYLEEPHGEDGFWPRLAGLDVPSLFVWGHRDTLVPIAFARHVREAVPSAEHLELDCGHIPQLEAPRETNAAISRFLAG